MPRLVLCAAMFILAAAKAAPGPGKADPPDRSSTKKYFGVGGWLDGRDCATGELYWVARGDADPIAWFRAKDGTPMKLGSGMAMFSPDCSHFWFAGYATDSFQIRDLSAKVERTVKGSFPQWTEDSKAIFYSSQTGTVLKLRRMDLQGKDAEVLSVNDAGACLPPGEGVAWHPVKILPEGRVLWTYPAAGTRGDPTFSPATSLTIDLGTQKIIESKAATLECD